MMPTSIAPDLDALNEAFAPLTPVERLQRLYTLWSPSEVLLTSSFGAESALLLYWISNVRPDQVVHFLDTGYHFEETLAYRQQLTQAFDLRVQTLQPDAAQHEQTLSGAWWATQPDRCCAVNKVQPLAHIQLDHRVWISGLKHYQTPQRGDLSIFEQKDHLLKFYPLIDVSEAEFEAAWTAASLPRHPLQALGYHSIGCWHCTQRGKGRSGRWQGRTKTECGLHFR